MKNPTTPADTRPISLLSHIAKVFDHIITKQITQYLEKSNLLSPLQSGFRTGFNTQTALLNLTEFIRREIELNKVIIVIFFDIKKAFDTINHKEILKELFNLGFSQSALRLLWSYITNRNHKVVSKDGHESSIQFTTSGVPQGSAPGPKLFLASINSLFSALNYCKQSHGLFADDLEIHISVSVHDFESAVSKLRSEASSIANYFNSKGLELNTKKIEAIVFGSDYNLNNLKSKYGNGGLPKIQIQGEHIEYSDKVKYLGITLTSDLKWNDQVSSISRKVHYTLHRLRNSCFMLSESLKLKLVKTLIIPIFDYACITYHDLPLYLDNKLTRVLNCAIRFIYGLRRDVHMTPYRSRANLLSPINRRRYFIGCLFYKIFNTGCPSYLAELIQTSDSIRRTNRLNVPMNNIDPTYFIIPKSRTGIYYNSFTLTAERLWNSLPLRIKTAPSLNIFSGLLLDFLTI